MHVLPANDAPNAAFGIGALPDNGGAYGSTLHAIACRTLGIRHLRTRPYRPQTNGKAERSSSVRAQGAPLLPPHAAGETANPWPKTIKGNPVDTLVLECLLLGVIAQDRLESRRAKEQQQREPAPRNSSIGPGFGV